MSTQYPHFVIGCPTHARYEELMTDAEVAAAYEADCSECAFIDPDKILIAIDLVQQGYTAPQIRALHDAS